MKKFLILSVVAAAFTFATGKVSANPVLNVSGTIQFQNATNTVKGSQLIATTFTSSFNNKQVYNLVSNAVANAAVYDTAIVVPTNLPANGYIAYSPTNFTALATNFYTYDTNIVYTNVFGVFYVTNKSGFYYPLSGLDTNGNYYSFVELDTLDFQYGQLGFGYDFNAIFSYNYNTNTGNGPQTDTDTALLYIHDNPLSYDDADYPDKYLYNANAIEIRGVFKLNLTFKQSFVNSGSAALFGTGNLVIDGNNNYGMVSSGNVRLQ